MIPGRAICLDVETTGLAMGEDRIIEIGCVELQDGVATGATFHAYANPGRRVGASGKIHGLNDTFLQDKPAFPAILPDLLAFLGEAPIIAHNASFDSGMLRAELLRLKREPLANPVVDTLPLARSVKKRAPHTLDALCDHFGIDRRKRQTHSALLDAQLLADVYRCLIQAPQSALDLGVTMTVAAPARVDYGARRVVSRITAAEQAAHAAFVATLGPNALWLDYAGVA